MNRRLLCLITALSLACALPAAQQRVIIVVEEAADTQPMAPSVVDQAPVRDDARTLERWFYEHPGQIMIESDAGPIPFYTDVIYDAAGMPRPRIPEYFAWRLAADPTPENAALYMAQRKAKTRRLREVTELVRRTAIEHGYVTPEIFSPPARGNPHEFATRPNPRHTPENSGSVALGPETAHELGLRLEDLPILPHKATSRYVEAFFFWDTRCEPSLATWPAWSAVAEEVFTGELGPRFTSISLNNDADAVNAHLAFLRYQEMDTNWSENRIDETDLATSLGITHTPTIVIIDRRSGRIERHVGTASVSQLRDLLKAAVGREDQAWEAAEPAWFRPVRPAIGASPVTAAVEARPGATPRLPPPRQVRAWSPIGVSD